MEVSTASLPQPYFVRPQHAERRLLLLLLPMFFGASLAGWAVSEIKGLARWFEHFCLIPASVIFAILFVIALKTSPIHIWRVRTAVLVVGPGVVMVRYFQKLYDLATVGFDPLFYFDLSTWLVLAGSLFLFLLPARMSWRFAAGYYALTMLLMVVFFLINENPLPSFVVDEFIMNYVITPPVFIALFSAFTKLRSDYVRARTHAETLEEQALEDALTGLHNRRAFSQAYRRAAARQVRNKTPLCAVLLDIDHFKRVNDTYGHQVGDEVLQKLARVLTRELRGSDEVFRWGGEEFMLLLENTPVDGAVEVAERIRKAVEVEPILDRSPVTISLGVTEIIPGEPEDVIYPRADVALYASKRDGRNRVSVEQVQPQVSSQ